MPVYGAIIINKSRKPRYCSDCQGEIIGRHIRLFGNGEESDPPHNIWLHRKCIDKEYQSEKVKAILTEFDKEDV